MTSGSNPLAPRINRKGLDLWLHAAYMSQAAYKDAGAWRLQMVTNLWTEAGFIEPGAGFQAGWAWSPGLDLLEISCRGSSQARDYTLDASSWVPNRWSQLPAKWWVGYGMVKGPRKAWPEILALFGRFEPLHVLWSGHSKGAGEAQLAHAATLQRSLTSSCVAIEPPRVFKSFARDGYRADITRDGCRSVVVINTKDGYRDAVTAYPRGLKHGGDLSVLGESTVYEGADALREWDRFKRGERDGWSPGRRVKGRFGAHGIGGVIEHMERLKVG